LYNRLKHIITFRLKRLRNNFFDSNLYFSIKLNFLLPSGLYDKKYINASLEEVWDDRIKDVIDCTDNKLIKRHPDAGKVKNGKQTMHNGIVITLGGYYGEAITQMLYRNKGVHEPQEEYAFNEVLKTMRQDATMLELGSYWSFYSIWFNKMIPKAKNFLIEPEKANMLYGINNFKLNNVKGKFTKAFVGKEAGMNNNIPIICVDDFIADNKIEFIDILHSDIQGFEHDMLLGASKTIKEKKIGYFFISKHGNKVHYECIDFLKLHDFIILCSCDEFDTYSLDGLIVAKYKMYSGIDKLDISLKTKVI
jgi:Methyltransferase FkbM domain